MHQRDKNTKFDYLKSRTTVGVRNEKFFIIHLDDFWADVYCFLSFQKTQKRGPNCRSLLVQILPFSNHKLKPRGSRSVTLDPSFSPLLYDHEMTLY